jgi:SAM-dependent methyltransferase
VTAVVDIRHCTVCGSSSIAAVIQRPLSQFLSGRASYYRLDSLNLTGNELMGYVRCRDCSFVFASPTLDSSLELATYNDAKSGQPETKPWMSDHDAASLYQTHHKWVDLNPFVLGLGFHFSRYEKPKNPGMTQVRLLDVGCGYGHTLELARVFGVYGVGCDLDQSRIAACRAKGLRVFEPSCVEGVYDLIVSSNVIEHVYDLHAYIGMISRHIAPQGVFVFNGLEESVIGVEMKKPRFKLLHPIEHRNVLTRKSLKRLLGDHGLRLVTRAEIARVMRRVRSKAPLYLPFFVKNGFVAANGVFSAIATHDDRGTPSSTAGR